MARDDAPSRAHQALNLDHEKRLLELEARMSLFEEIAKQYRPTWDEQLIAQAIAVRARQELGSSLKRWQKWGIAVAGGTSIVGSLAVVAQVVAQLVG